MKGNKILTCQFHILRNPIFTSTKAVFSSNQFSADFYSDILIAQGRMYGNIAIFASIKDGQKIR